MAMAKNHRKIVLVLLAFMLGFIWAISLRFVLVDNDAVHYHADFAIYIDGERDMLDNFTFYEEIAACSAAYSSNPASRVHLHDSVPTLAHVHDNASTWSHLLDNLNYTLSNDLIVTDKGVFTEDEDGKELRFILNGKITRGVANKAIASEDVLLIDYSNDTEDVLQDRYSEVVGLAMSAEANTKPDPATCSGSTTTETFSERLKRTLGIE